MILQMKNEDLIKSLSPLVLLAKSNDRHQLPIYSHIRIETTFTHVIFNAADGLRFLSVMIENPNGNVGVCTVHAKSLFDLIETFHIGSVTKLELVGPEKLVVKNGRSKFNLTSSDPAMFPLFQVPAEGYATVHPQALLDAFSVVDASIAADSTRPAMECIFFGPSKEEGFMRAVATDGHKLTSCKVPGVLPSDFLLHKDNLVMLRALFKGQEECEIFLTDNVLLFRGATWAYQTRLLDVKRFPAFETIFETHTPITVEVNVLEFKAAIDRCLMFAGNFMHVLVTCKEDVIEVSANSEGGSGAEEVAVLLAESLPSEFKFGVNGEYLSMLLKRFETKKVTLKMAGPLKPILLTENTNFVSLLMPCKI